MLNVEIKASLFVVEVELFGYDVRVQGNLFKIATQFKSSQS